MFAMQWKAFASEVLELQLKTVEDKNIPLLSGLTFVQLNIEAGKTGTSFPDINEFLK